MGVCGAGSVCGSAPICPSMNGESYAQLLALAGCAGVDFYGV